MRLSANQAEKRGPHGLTVRLLSGRPASSNLAWGTTSTAGQAAFTASPCDRAVSRKSAITSALFTMKGLAMPKLAAILLAPVLALSALTSPAQAVTPVTVSGSYSCIAPEVARIAWAVSGPDGAVVSASSRGLFDGLALSPTPVRRSEDAVTGSSVTMRVWVGGVASEATVVVPPDTCRRKAHPRKRLRSHWLGTHLWSHRHHGHALMWKA